MNDPEFERAFETELHVSRIVVTRETGKRDRSRHYAIRIDGTLRGKVRQGDSLELLTSEGDHVLEVALGQSARSKINISTKANEVSYFVLRAGDLSVPAQSWIEIVAAARPTD